MSKMIRFNNAAQAIIFECELLGQISDGYWENAKPHDHYEDFDDVKVTHAFHAESDGAVVGKNFRTRRAYNFNAPELLKCVGQRMINFVKFYTAFPNTSLENHWDFSYDDESAQSLAMIVAAGLNQSSGYYHTKAERIMSAINAKTLDDVIEAMKRVDAIRYDMKDLKKDLKEIRAIVNGVA